MIQLEDLSAKVNPWYKEAFPALEQINQAGQVIGTNSPLNSAVSIDTNSLLSKMFRSKNGTKIKKLYNGDISEYGSDHSAADMAFCNALAFWTGKNADQMDSIFRSSGLYRQKWDVIHYPDTGETYGQHTINQAIKDTKSVYQRDFPLTDLGNAERFAAQHGHRVKYCYQYKQWYIWNGKRWIPDISSEIKRLAKETIRSICAEAAATADEDRRKDLIKHALRSEKESAIKAMLSLAQAEPEIAITADQFDKNNWLLNVDNGTIDLKTGILHAHNPADLITKLAPIPYIPGTKDQRWEDFLESVIPNVYTRCFFQRAIGYSLTGDTGEEKIFFLFGPGGTGKSTSLGTVQAVLGDYATTADFDAFLINNSSGGPRNDIARLAGKRFVISVEVDDGRKLAEGLVNQLTGGDTITARFLYAEAFEFIPTFKIWLAANSRPKITSDRKSGIWRRILQLPFIQEIAKEKRDPELKKYLKDPNGAGPAVLVWAVNGCLEWQLFGLGVPAEVEEATLNYMDAMDPLKDFLMDRCLINPLARIKITDLWCAYTSWCYDNNEKPIDKHPFTQNLIGRGFEQKRTNKERIWIGLKLIDTYNTTVEKTFG